MNKTVSIAEVLSTKAQEIAELQREHAKLESAARILREGGYPDDEIGFMFIEAAPPATAQKHGPASELPDLHAPAEIDEIAMWFDLLRDMAIRLGDEVPSGSGEDLAWSIQKLAEKFGDDTRRFASTQLAQTKGGAA